jgi:hypothetical protein
LDLASFASRYVALDQESASLFARVILILAKVSFCPSPTLRMPLPPAEDVLKDRNLPCAVRQLYELVQTPNSHVPHLSIFQMYELWTHLHEVRSSSPQFHALVSGLDAYTLFFRATMSNLARMDIASCPREAPES